jgi:glutamyl-tRNA synthetase
VANPRVRFAPSPTGYLHVGGARTALFNWLYARKTGGEFLLRIEDTDRERSSDEHTRVILDGLTWLGLDWDGEVVFQGARVGRHQDVADQLVRTGHAYQEDGAIRFRVPREEIAWEDAVHGRISFQGEDLKDFIILRSDRTPIYNFSVVVDDVDMRITHVIRGDDHISNTPKQIALYRALGLEHPIFAHVPMIHGMDGKKLSKRHGATAVGDYQNLGILPAALRNFLALLGWSPGNDRELFFEVKEMIDAFTMEAVQKKAAIFDMKKLEWMNGQYLSQTAPEILVPLIASQLSERGLEVARLDQARLLRAIRVVRGRARTTIELAHRVAVRLDAAALERDVKATQAIARDPENFRVALRHAAERLGALAEADWDPTRLEAELRALAESVGVAADKIFQPIRIALTGTTVSEPVNELLWVVDKSASLERLRAAQDWVKASA